MPLHEYRIIEKMATGSFGVVFKIKRILDDHILVMKRIPLQDLDPEQRHEAAQELFLMSELHHPYIVGQRDAFLFNDNDLCLVMDYYDGGDMDLLIARQRDKDTYFPLERVMLWLVEMTLAVDYLHSQGILHRDIKTRNFFVDKRTNSIAVGDFGIAERIDLGKLVANTFHQRTAAVAAANRRRSSSVGSHTPSSQKSPSWSGQQPAMDHNVSNRYSPMRSHHNHSGQHGYGDSAFFLDENGGSGAHFTPPPPAAMKGTPLYMAPEALQGAVVGPTSDVWSLGCILYELLSLRHPFETRDIGALVMHVTRGEREPLPAHYPPEVVALVDWMLTLNPSKRPTCAEVLRLPFVNVFVRRLFALRVSTNPESPEEAALAQQGQIFILPASRQQVQWHNIQAELKPPEISPSAEREAVEKKRAAAARAAALAMAAGGSQTSSVSGGGGGAFGTGTAGTFFVAGTSPFAYVEHSPVDTYKVGCQEPTDSMRQYMIYDEPPSAPDSASRHPLEVAGTPPIPSARVSPNKHQQAHRRRYSAEEQFLRDHPNIIDICDEPLAVLAQEVVRMRALVQLAIREGQRMKNATMLLKTHGEGLATTMPWTFSGVPPQRMLSVGGDAEALAGRLSSGHGGRDVRQPGSVAIERAKRSPGLGVYLQRRSDLVAAVLTKLPPSVLATVYAYYQQTSLLRRDPAVVMGWVPHPEQWLVLPAVEEIIVLDKLLEGNTQ